MRFAKNKLLNLTEFKARLRQAESAQQSTIPIFKGAIKDALLTLKQSQNEVPTAELIEKFTWMIDQLVLLIWHKHTKGKPDFENIALIAVGGYGRGELHPFSDVDLLILLKQNDYLSPQEPIEELVRFLWDIGLDVGHSVRSFKDCLKEARQDITVMTNLLEARHLCGDQSLLISLDERIRQGRIWPADKYFAQKVQEQEDRHAQYQDTAYTLEPNIKETPGGLRDLQNILWVYNRHYGARSFKEMNEQGHINDDEYRILIRARNILWKIRAGLHLNTNRHEDRLLFDTQRELAQEFGYQDTKANLAVEQLMKRYYRTAQQIIYLNEVLLAHYRVSNSSRFSLAGGKVLDDDFVLKNKMIEQRHDNVFSDKPSAILKMFVLMQELKITVIHPDTIRAVRANLSQINTGFRSDPEAQALFLRLFQSKEIGITNALARMNAYGVLGAYLPSFGAIVGQMQHDLFHVYTVDGHTLMVIQYLTRLRKYPDEFPLASALLDGLYKPERLFISALFHDIAKGRGGDHSVLGEVDAYQFCIAHGLSEYDAKLVGWLVLNHLIMSHFSQRRDISDPVVIEEFANIVGDIEHLDNLYLLTLADIRGTSPKVWNAWKGQLLLELYRATHKALLHGVAKPLDEQAHVNENQRSAMEKIERQLSPQSFNKEEVEQFWSTLPNDYFMRNEPFYIAWHASSLAQSSAISLPIVSVRYSERLEATMFFVFAPESSKLLSKVTASFDAMEINIIEARLQQSSNGHALYSINGLVSEQENPKSTRYNQFLERNLRQHILKQSSDKAISRRHASRALKHFPIKPKVLFTFNNPTYSAMEVIAQDQPGLLHNVALILQRNSIRLVSARIATFGERVEDMFYIQNIDQTPVTDKATLKNLSQEICRALDRTLSKSKLSK